MSSHARHPHMIFRISYVSGMFRDGSLEENFWHLQQRNPSLKERNQYLPHVDLADLYFFLFDECSS